MTKRFIATHFGIVLLLFLRSSVTCGDDHNDLELVNVQRIWDKAAHNAFTDLIHFHGHWYCVFREGQSHVSPDGALRVITSADGNDWKSAALLTSKDSDLRDAKITVSPTGQLMLAGAEALNQPKTHRHQSLVWLSSDGRNWGQAHEVGNRDNWLWRITWHGDKAYGFGYGCRQDNRGLTLFQSIDGQQFVPLIEQVVVEGTYPNETSIVFLPDHTAYCLLRQDGEPNNGFVGLSKPPYRTWQWQQLNLRIGGPHMIRLPDGRLLAAVRLYDSPVRTSLCWLDPVTATLTEALRLPSGGDTSYAGLVWHDNLLWISYYASHEGKTSVYLAKVRVTTE